MSCRVALVLLLCLSFSQRVSAQTAGGTSVASAPLLFARPPEGVLRPAPQASPPNGRAGLIVGGIALGLAAVNLALLPVCHADFYRENDAETPCVVISYIYAGLATTVGIISLAIGSRRRAQFREWQALHQSVTLLEGVRLSATRGGAGLAFRTTF
jgi:hypothetical protein